MPYPAKAIPPNRDRLQSRILIWIGVPSLIYLVFSEYLLLFQNHSASHGGLGIGFLRGSYLPWQGRYDNSIAQVIAVSLIFALAAWRLRAATAGAAACGGLTCLLISNSTTAISGTPIVQSGLTPLILLFVLTFEATRLRRKRKSASVPDADRKGRNTAQIIANLGIAAFFASTTSLALAMNLGWFGDIQGDGAAARAYFAIPYIPMLAALCEATADTVSSEIGQAFGGTPILLTTRLRVPPGTDGAISLNGTLAGLAAAAVVAISAMPAIGMTKAECIVAFAAGVAGLIFDSLLGATLERRGYINNDLVNFASTAFAAALTLPALKYF